MLTTTKPPRVKPVRPWTPGSVRPVRLRPGPREASHEAVDRPTPIRELAEAHRVRWYRDACGDDHIPGKYGEIFRVAVGCLGVQIGGARANGTQTDVPEGSNVRVNAVARRFGWTIAQLGDGEAIFAVPEETLKDALGPIGAYRRPAGRRPSPGVIARGRENLRKAREARQSG